MSKQILDLSSFAKAVKTLEEALSEFTKDKTNSFVRDSVIQRFEYTYELAHKMLKRFLLYSEFSGQDIAEMVFANIVRTANEKGLLLNNLEKWEEYRKIRNMTSHTYDETKAKLVIAVVPEFLQEAVFLLEQLRQRSKKL
ncbi:MAG: nucleotidyltransferase substrate binding protein [Candidatus Margulisbacteria bacterium]|jgi:nucleotidyltransferase substrate binding protein (TIGR01987 family)|nr:nucleotidyltransferase substrate binding protein [Candidatus Margulisiibacteriota bacterium]